MPFIEGSRGVKEAYGEYDFAVDGGAISTIVLRGDGSMPIGSIIMGGFIEVDTAVTSGGAATVAVNSEAAGDLQAAITVAGAPWSTTGRKAILPVWTAASFVKLTANRSLAIAIAAFALTAGKFRVVVFYR